MSRKPNKMTARKPSTKKTGKKKPTPDTGGEETPITISGGSILIESLVEREETGVKKHKKCKIPDVPGKKWKPIRAEIHDKNGGLLQSFPMAADDKAVVIFERPK
jgi:hypothetical protein